MHCENVAFIFKKSESYHLPMFSLTASWPSDLVRPYITPQGSMELSYPSTLHEKSQESFSEEKGSENVMQHQ